MVYSAIYISSYWNRYPKMHNVSMAKNINNASISTNASIPTNNNKNNLEQILVYTSFVL
jgi:hypothetical protein